MPVGAAEVKRLGVAAGAGSGHGEREVRQLLNDPRGQAMGLGRVQEAVRQSFEALQPSKAKFPADPT